MFGVYAPGEDVARLTFFGLHALQHRGQESAGIATSDGREITSYARMGLVTQVFDERALSSLRGISGIGHTRYSTTGSSALRNAQPFVVEGSGGKIALAHNGNVVNADLMRSELAAQGITFETGTDSEVVAELLANAPGETWEERFEVVMRRASGSYCLTVLTLDAVYAVRDPMGNRPLCIGRVNGDDASGYIVASETCALDHLGAEFVREVEPGEVVRIDADGLHSFFPALEPQQTALCLFEYMYFARPDSHLSGELVYPVRTRMGAQLAREHPAEADLVIGVPDSGIPAAIGYARESGLSYAEGLIKNRYVGRTFIEPDQRLREQGVRLKLNPLPDVLRGRSVVVVEDTIVRGTTNKPVVAMLRRAGARRGAHAHCRAADHASVLLRRRYGDAWRVDRRAPERRPDPRAHRRGLAGIPVAGGHDRGHEAGRQHDVHRLLHRQLPQRGAAATGQVRARRGGEGRRDFASARALSRIRCRPVVHSP